MVGATSLTILLASPEPELLAAGETALLAAGARVEVVLSAQAALVAMTAANPPGLALLDVNLPDIPMEHLLASVRTETSGRRFPILLIADAVTEEWKDRLAEGVIDDLFLRKNEDAYWQVRIESARRAQELARELESLRESVVRNAQLDGHTGVYNREALLANLFRETDRVQRLNSSLCLILFDIDDFGHWNSRLGAKACDELLCQVAARAGRLLRSYDLVGRPGMDEFLLVLPGCTPASAVLLAERLRMDVFRIPFHVSGESIRGRRKSVQKRLNALATRNGRPWLQFHFYRRLRVTSCSPGSFRRAEQGQLTFRVTASYLG